jgi:hypothetical protein
LGAPPSRFQGRVRLLTVRCGVRAAVAELLVGWLGDGPMALLSSSPADAVADAVAAAARAPQASGQAAAAALRAEILAALAAATKCLPPCRRARPNQGFFFLLRARAPARARCCVRPLASERRVMDGGESGARARGTGCARR